MVRFSAKATVVAIVLAVASCARQSEPATETPRLPEAAVYQALLEALADYRIAGKMTVIRTTARIDSRLLPVTLRGDTDSVSAEWQSALVAISTRRLELTAADLGVPSILYSEAKGRRLADTSLGGARMLALSPIAFNADSTRALVYFELHCGGLCGGSSLVLLERADRGAWRHRRTFRLVSS